MGERTLGKQAAQEIRDFKGNEKGIRAGVNPKNIGEQYVADKAHESGNHGHHADNSAGFEKLLTQGQVFLGV